MTAPALPRDDQAVEQAFDIVLEELMDGEVRCQGCEAPATHALTHHNRCPEPLCEPCADRWLRFLARGFAAGGVIFCPVCGARPIPLDAITKRPI